MKPLKLGLSYITWHYSRAFADIFRNAKNLLWFTYHFFSISVLARNFFAPWKRLGVDRQERERVGDVAERFVVNTLMRLVGMLFRTVLILCGLLALLIMFLAAVLFVVLWILLPVLMIAFLLKGVSVLIGYPPAKAV